MPGYDWRMERLKGATYRMIKGEKDREAKRAMHEYQERQRKRGGEHNTIAEQATTGARGRSIIDEAKITTRHYAERPWKAKKVNKSM